MFIYGYIGLILIKQSKVGTNNDSVIAMVSDSVNDGVNDVVNVVNELRSELNEMNKKYSTLYNDKIKLDKKLLETQQIKNDFARKFELNLNELNKIKSDKIDLLNKNSELELQLTAKMNEYNIIFDNNKILKQNNDKLIINNDELQQINHELTKELQMLDDTLESININGNTSIDDQRNSDDIKSNELNIKSDVGSNYNNYRSKSIMSNENTFMSLDNIYDHLNNDEYKFMYDLNKEKERIKSKKSNKQKKRRKKKKKSKDKAKKSKTFLRPNMDAEQEFFMLQVLACKIDLASKGCSNSFYIRC